MTSPRAAGLAAAAVALAAAAWFWPGIWLTLEWVDQGQIVYGAWRVARGDLPYRDFDHLYGPSIFFLNGALMRCFGENLDVVRLGLLAVKALLAGFVFLVCRSVARPAIALTVTAWFVVQWGAPLWIYATPYAGHYALACCIAGLAIASVRRAIDAPTALAAGLCVGLGATFKHTTGLFIALGFLVVLASRPSPAGTRDGLAGFARAIRLAVTAGTALVIVAYFSGTLGTVTGAVLAALPLLALAAEWVRDRRQERELASGRTRVATTLAFGAGFLVPLTAWAAFYVSRGALGDLVHDLLVGIPPRVRWHVPLERPHFSTLLVVASLALGAFGLATARPRLTVLGGAVTAVLFLVASVVPEWTILELQATRLLPIAVMWTTAALALRRGAGEAPRWVWWSGAMGCLALHPSSDLAHALMILPVVLPSVALLIETAWSRSTSPLARAGVVALVGAPLLARAVPDAANLLRTVNARPATWLEFDRARGVWDPNPQFAETREVLTRLDRRSPRGTSLLVLPNAQLLYVLADRPSALPHAEVILYFVAHGLLTPDDARTLMPGNALVERLQAARPEIVRRPDAGWTRIATAYPELRTWIDDHYDLADTVGNVQILVPRDP